MRERFKELMILIVVVTMTVIVSYTQDVETNKQTEGFVEGTNFYGVSSVLKNQSSYDNQSKNVNTNDVASHFWGVNF